MRLTTTKYRNGYYEKEEDEGLGVAEWMALPR